MNSAAHDLNLLQAVVILVYISVTFEGAEDLKKMDSPFMLRVPPEIIAEWEGAFLLRKK